mmetsp:Transcript_15619/g.36511  ORF Transcript_15619/g.36511 Transcript_15619/m.36511 type:complete len:291 (-) Transcript_15619:45-917(-)|eukprot:CAMPEP_0171098310 /NCGR_PEP_ID=MMETSP0766_2-20121228/48048_1 /TAXON_ID=439317 /ORGANISM="Gambierdiscus australes, Strain CAWD 149" /LENGTH=290 /DNA_ID=CAMNT_0011557635 /DNA_START=83 /DNA_END=955 /DNA_ORIENTATION=+
MGQAHEFSQFSCRRSPRLVGCAPCAAVRRVRRSVVPVITSVALLLLAATKLETLFVGPETRPSLRPMPKAATGRYAVQALPSPDFEVVVAEAVGTYTDALAEDPVMTKIMTAALLVTLGDALSQAMEGEPEATPHYDVLRGLSFALFGAMYTGAFQHWWFLTLNDVIPVPPDANAAQLLFAAIAKTSLCQFGSIPLVYIPLFFGLTGVLRGLSVQETCNRARSLYWPLLSRNITYWFPVQMVQFLFVEPEWQVPYVCAAGFVWSVLLSQLAGPLKEADERSGLTQPAVSV